jgi:hypothetical protein
MAESAAEKVADYKLVGSYVSTPLNWAVITGARLRHFFTLLDITIGKDTKYNSIADLRGSKIGISRIGRLVECLCLAKRIPRRLPTAVVKSWPP